MAELFKAKPNQSVAFFGDEIPRRQTINSIEEEGRDRPRRTKLVHQQGLVAKAEFIPTGENSYTGIFASGSDNAIIRLSEAGLIVPGVSDGLTPSFAIKYLRDTVHSANQFGMVEFDPQVDDWNFWTNDF